MKNTYLILVLIIASCASTDPYQKKMERYTARSGERILVPEIKAADIKFTNVKPSKRTPASVMSGESITNKKLYFLSLYAQYESLKTLTNSSSASDLNLCPSFHTGLVTYQEKHATNHGPDLEKKYSYNQAEFSNQKYLSTHPELFLPVEKEGTTPRVIDILRGMNNKTDATVSEVVQNALNLHLAKTYTELRELCDFGASSNYYIYENLITHIKATTFPPSTENMNILLKTTLFANRALITSLAKDKPMPMGRAIASEKSSVPYTDEVVSRLNVPWSNEYFSYIKETK